MYYGYILERLAIVSKYCFPVPVIYVSAALLLPEVINKVKVEKGYTTPKLSMPASRT